MSYVAIREAVAVLKYVLHEFNAWWPKHVVHGEVWELALHRKGMTPEALEAAYTEFNRRTGKKAIDLATAAIAELDLREGQDPNRTLRLPGWFGLDEPPTVHAQRVNDARAYLQKAITDLAGEMGAKVSASKTFRGKLLRSACPGISVRQVFRKVQAFDATPRTISFIWAGETAAHSKTTVGDEIDRLDALDRALSPDARSLTIKTKLAEAKEHLQTMDRETKLVAISKAPEHPRAMLYYRENSKYDAMLHASLPLFVYLPRGEQPPRIHGLNPFDPTKTTGAIPRERGAKILEHASRSLYRQHKPLKEPQPRLASAEMHIKTTYGQMSDE